MIRFIKAFQDLTVPARPGDVIRIVDGQAAVKVVCFDSGVMLAKLHKGDSYRRPSLSAAKPKAS